MINKLAQEIYQNAKDKGFYEKERNIGEMLALVHSEVSEALEADRKGKYCHVLVGDGIALGIPDEQFKEKFIENVKETFEDEIADAIIRLLDLSAFKKIDLEAHIKAKMRYNSLREYKHNKKY